MGHDLARRERVDGLSALATEVNVRLIQPNDFLFKTTSRA